MLTQTRTCDKCNKVIPSDQYDFAQKIRVCIGHYDKDGVTLEFCSTCWTKLYASYAPARPAEGTPALSVAERVNNLMAEVIELLTPQQ